MTVNHVRVRRGLAAGACRTAFALLALVPAAAALAQSKSAAPAPAPRTVIVPPSAAVRYRQSVSQQQINSRLQQNQVEEQLRQQRAATTRLPYANDPTVSGQLDQADRAKQNTYQSRQQDTVDRYNNAAATSVAAPSVRRAQSRPAAAGSGK